MNATEQPTVRQLEPIVTEIMEARLTGESVTYVEKLVTKYAYQCLGCGLVWAIRWHAESCASRQHRPSFEQSYYSSRLNAYGKPYPPTVYIRAALRREPLPQEGTP